MTTASFAVTWDYRCPFARNAHEHLTAGLRDGAPWEVTFSPFSLSQVHVPEGGAAVWEDPAKAKDLLAMLVGISVRDQFPERFLSLHDALFAARHDEGRDLRDAEVLSEVLAANEIDVTAVMDDVASGRVLEEFRTTHDESVKAHDVFGVPTFVLGDRAVFVRLTTRPQGDAELARATVERVLGLISERPEINEFKSTSIWR